MGHISAICEWCLNCSLSISDEKRPSCQILFIAYSQSLLGFAGLSLCPRASFSIHPVLCARSHSHPMPAALGASALPAQLPAHWYAPSAASPGGDSAGTMFKERVKWKDHWENLMVLMRLHCSGYAQLSTHHNKYIKTAYQVGAWSLTLDSATISFLKMPFQNFIFRKVDNTDKQKKVTTINISGYCFGTMVCEGSLNILAVYMQAINA